MPPKSDNAEATARFAIFDHLATWPHLRQLKTDELAELAEGLLEAIQSPDTAWAFMVIFDRLQRTS